MRSMHPRFVHVLAAMLAMVLVADALAQSRRSRRQPNPVQQQQNTNAAAKAWDLKPSPFIQRESDMKRWTMNATVFIGTSEWTEFINGRAVPANDEWEFTAATLVFPVIPETASSILEVKNGPDGEVPAVSGKVEFGDHLMTDEVTIVTQGIGGGLLPVATWRAQWEVPPPPRGAYSPREVELHVQTSVTSFNTVFDEVAAREVEWPTGEWPPEAAATFHPQMFVDFDANGRGYDMEPIVKLLESWTGGKNPKSVKPVVLAKYLTQQVFQHVNRVNGEGFTFDKNGGLQGFLPVGPSAAVQRRRGTNLDLPITLLAFYRAAGIPSRLVIGYDEVASDDGVYLQQSKGESDIRVWVEFALYDEVNETFGWVPVDILAMRAGSSRLKRDFLDAPQEYFGTHDELEGVIPLAFHFHPPTTVRAYGSPALWGWFATPVPPGRADQRVSIQASSSSTGGRDQTRLPRDRRR